MDYNFANFSEGYGVSSAKDVDELNKALEAGAGPLLPRSRPPPPCPFRPLSQSPGESSDFAGPVGVVL